MTATAPITWPDLVFDAQLTGRLPVVIPTASYPLVGCFRPLPQYEHEFIETLYHSSPRARVYAITCALMSTRAEQGMEF